MTREVCNDHILLVGFMGSGKTSVSRKMSTITGMSLIDVDYRVEAIQHKKIIDLFAELGEEGFRRVETETLAGLKYERRSIISCGGGIVCNPVNRPILKSLGTVIFLDVPVLEAVGRISRPERRPLLSGEHDVEAMYAERLPFYEEVADITIHATNTSVYHVARMCVSALEERGLL